MEKDAPNLVINVSTTRRGQLLDLNIQAITRQSTSHINNPGQPNFSRLTEISKTVPSSERRPAYIGKCWDQPPSSARTSWIKVCWAEVPPDEDDLWERAAFHTPSWKVPGTDSLSATATPTTFLISNAHSPMTYNG
jgi:hypothetical protein